MNVPQVAAFAAVGFGLLVAHNVADHWVQTDNQASNKGLPGSAGRLACFTHVLSYTMVTTLFVGSLWVVLDLPFSVIGLIAGQLTSAVSHYWADRRFTLAKLCDRLGKRDFYRLGASRNLMAQEYTLSSGRKVVQLSEIKSDYKPPIPWDNVSLGTGAYVLDQSWHWFWLFVAALVTVAL